MLKVSHYIAIALAFLVAASLRASASERTSPQAARGTGTAIYENAPPRAPHALPWRLVFR